MHGTPVDITLQYTGKELKLFMDVMHVDDEMFLVSTEDPLNLTLQCKVKNQPTIVYIDLHSSFRAMTQDFLGVKVDVGGMGDFVS